MIASNTTTADPAQAREFIARIFEDGDVIEIRDFPDDNGGNSPHCNWHTPAEFASQNGELSRLLATRPTFVGINPRTAKGRAGDANVKHCRFVFADFDPPKGDPPITVDDAYAKVRAAKLPDPCIIVQSGRGPHFYWQLDTPTDGDGFRAIQRGIAATLDTDPVVCNPERIMRLPGSIHRKGEPVLVELYRCLDEYVLLEDFVPLLRMPEPDPEPAEPVEFVPVEDQSEAERLCMKALAGLPDAVSGEHGHTATFRAACECYRFGLEDEIAARCLAWFNANKCLPAWTPRELQHKLTTAKQRVEKDEEFGARMATLDTVGFGPIVAAGQIAAEQSGPPAGLADSVKHASQTPTTPKPDDNPKWLTGDTLATMFTDGLAGGFAFHVYDLDGILNVPGHNVGCPFIVGQGFITLIGGQPGAGKSALVEQVCWHILETDPDARVFFANVELSPIVLLARHMTRLTGVSTFDILRGSLNGHELDAIEGEFDRLRPMLDRCIIYPNPRLWPEVAAAIQTTEANVVVCDYLQRFKGGEDASTQREDIGVVMQSLRACADGGRAVLAVSALSRSKSGSGSSYAASDGIASFRESSEVEYGADFGYIIANTENPGTKRLHVVKHRYGRLGTWGASFDGPRGEWAIGANLEGAE